MIQCAPDLAAFLILQCELLAEWAVDEGLHAEAKTWTNEAQSLMQALTQHLTNAGGFAARRLGSSGPETVECGSLLPCMGLIIGSRLTPELRKAAVAQIQNFLTPYGLATELPGTPIWQEEQFYWRGPAWAPSTYIAVTTLAAIGEMDLATTIAERYCRTCARSGFYENFDTRNGQGLCDSHYSWTAAVYIDLARRFLPRQ